MEQQQTLGGKPAKTDSYPEEQHEAKLAELKAETVENEPEDEGAASAKEEDGDMAEDEAKEEAEEKEESGWSGPRQPNLEKLTIPITINFGTDMHSEQDFTIDYNDPHGTGGISCHSSGQPTQSWQKAFAWVKGIAKREYPNAIIETVIEGNNDLRSMPERAQVKYLKEKYEKRYSPKGGVEKAIVAKILEDEEEAEDIESEEKENEAEPKVAGALPFSKYSAPPEAEKEEKEAGETCPSCGKVGVVETDAGLTTSRSCPSCIWKKHKLEEGKPDFSLKGDTVRFYSATTGWVEYPLKDIARLFGSIIGNSVFPYSINIINGYDHKDGTKSLNCLGITKEFGEWLLSNPNLNFKKVVKESPIGDNEDYYATPAWDKYEQEENLAKGDEPYKKSKLGKAKKFLPTCFKEKATGKGFLDNEEGETEYMCPKCPKEYHEPCLAQHDAAVPLATFVKEEPKIEAEQPEPIKEGPKAIITVVRKYYGEEFGGFPFTEVSHKNRFDDSLGSTHEVCDTEKEVVEAIKTAKEEAVRVGKVPIVEDKRVKLVVEEAV